MKKIAMIGFGDHVRKNIFPAISRSEHLDIAAVYVRNPEKYKSYSLQYKINFRSLYDDEIEKDVDWVYISTPISSHYDLALKYLSADKNVICEKPITESFEKTKTLYDVAEKMGKVLQEVCMYKYHAQFQSLKSTIENSDLKAVKVKFSIPHLSRDNIRYKKELSGGALLDVGYYPLSLIISLFGLPESFHTSKYSESGYEVDLFGAAVFSYGSFYCIAEWGIGLPYSNEVEVITELESIKYNRIFSKPHDFTSTVEYYDGKNREEKVIGADDHFVNLFESIVYYESTDLLKGKKDTLNVSKILSEVYFGT